MKTKGVESTVMQRIIAQFCCFADDQSGATAIEYAVIGGAITLAIVPGFYLVSGAMRTKFDTMVSMMTN
jgi:Flp pilus assembly pilin Flp